MTDRNQRGFDDDAGALDLLKTRIAAFSASEAQANAVEPLLRTDRRALAEALADFEARHSGTSIPDQWAEPHRLLARCRLRDLPRDSEDKYLADWLLQSFHGIVPPPGVLLAAMLLFQAFELPLPDDLDRIPDWLLPDYLRFLLLEPKIFHELGDAERYHGHVTEAVALLHRYILRRPSAPLSNTLLEIFIDETTHIQIYFNEHDLKRFNRDRAQLFESWLIANGFLLAHVFPLPAAAAPRERRLRIGVLCHNFAPQTETYFTLAYIERLPREHCHLTLYALQQSDHPLARHAAGIADEMVSLPHGNLPAAAARIRADDLDLLLIGTNVTVLGGALTLLACFRLARVQVISASSPVTSGLTSADWFLNAEHNETEEGARTQYTEQVYRMPGMLTRYAYHLDTDPRTITIGRAELGIPEDAVVFFSASNFFKVIPELSALWARVMAQVPEAWLVLMPFNPNWDQKYLSEPFCARVRCQVEEAGGDPLRALIIETVPTRADLHAVMALGDIYLDSYPFAGACSLLDPLLMGLPVVARTGRTFRGSVGAGMLRGLGLGDMAVANDEAYVARAVSLARDPELRKQARARIEAAMLPHNPVYDSQTGSRNFEAAVLDLVSRSEAADAALLQQPADRLRAAIERLAGELAQSGNAWFRSLNDVELVRVLLVPYFQSLHEDGQTPHMLDVGACAGQMAEPFLAMGWKAELFEPDPACQDTLSRLAAEHGTRASVHRLAISDRDDTDVTFCQSAIGLSGLSPSPYAATQATLRVPSTRLDTFARSNALKRVDLLKIDAEGWDFAALRSHDFSVLPPRLVMVEFGTEFPQQNAESVMAGIADLAHHGYDALVFSYEDDGNFKRQVWRYSLIAAEFSSLVARKDGHAAGNILFFRRDDRVFLVTVLRLFLGFLPPRERTRFAPN